MAVRARLTPPRETPTYWPWHSVKSASFRASILFGGDRRMEAESFLASGFGTRLAIESKPSGWMPLATVARTWQPSRLKGIQVNSGVGTPFLAATQVFDLRPIPRKWLSLERTDNVAQRFVTPGTILVTCSGTVGRTTLARKSLNNLLISHDLLRVEPKDDTYWGWLYAYLRAPLVIGLMQAAHYGHIIKHLEVAHLNDIPIIDIDQRARLHFTQMARRVFDHRNRAEALIAEAEVLLSSAFEMPLRASREATYSTVRCSELSSGRRRLEGSFHAISVKSLLKRLRKYAVRVDLLSGIVKRTWWMTRFSRSFGDNGVRYMSADDLFLD